MVRNAAFPPYTSATVIGALSTLIVQLAWIAAQSLLPVTPLRPTADVVRIGPVSGAEEVQIRSSLPLSSVRRDSDGLFRVTVALNGVPLRMVIDTGATTTVLTGRDAARVGLTSANLPSSELITTAAGPSAMRWSRVERADVGQMAFQGIDVAVMDHGLEMSLLGQNMLEKMGPMTIDGDQISFGRRALQGAKDQAG